MNKNIDDFDSYIKNIAKKVVVPEDIFNDTYKKLYTKDVKKSFKYKYVACFLLIFIIISCIFIYKVHFNNINNLYSNSSENNNKNNNENTTDNVSYSSSNLPIASYSISLSNETNISSKFISPIDLDIIKQDSDCIAVVKLNKILYYTNYSEKLNQYTQIPLTASNVTIEKVFKGNLTDNLEMLSVGGILSIKDFEKACEPEQIKKHGFDKMSDDEKENTYIEIKSTMTFRMPKLEDNKYYLVYLKYNDNFEKYQVLDQFMYEYDITNDTIKNTDTNEWIKFEYN